MVGGCSHDVLHCCMQVKLMESVIKLGGGKLARAPQCEAAAGTARIALVGDGEHFSECKKYTTMTMQDLKTQAAPKWGDEDE